MAFYAPDPIQSTQLIPGGNTPAAGGLLFCYSVGTTTKQNSYTDQTASTARTNPIVLDSGGNIPGNGEVWIASSAKFVLAPSNDTDPPGSPYWTRDNLPGVNNVTSVAGASVGEWVTGSTATFVGVTQFTLVGDQTLLYTVGRRVKATVTGGDRYGVVTSSAFGANTAVGLALDSGALDAGLSAVYYGIVSTPNGSIPWTQYTSSGSLALGPLTFFNVPQNQARATVSSASQIWTASGNVLDFVGTTNITSFATAPQAGATRTLIINSSVSFVSSNALAITYTANPGDRIDVIATSAAYANLYVIPGLGSVATGTGLVFIASTQAAQTSAIAFNSTVINTTFDEYEFHYHQVNAASSIVAMMMRLSSTNGTNWITTNRWTGSYLAQAGTNWLQHGSGTTTQILLSSSSGVTGTLQGEVVLYRPNDASNFKDMGTKQFESGGSQLYGSADTVTLAGAAVNAIQFFFNSGNISTGSFYAYGLRK